MPPRFAVGAAAWGRAYRLMRAECVPPSRASEAIREYLRRATLRACRFASDTTHLSPAGIRHIGAHVQELVEQTGADLVTSDSTLCAVSGTWRDYDGNVISSVGISAPVRPFWGSAFLHKKNPFSRNLFEAWGEVGGRSILLLVAGNDLGEEARARAIACEMYTLKVAFRHRGATLHIVDVVPPGYQFF